MVNIVDLISAAIVFLVITLVAYILDAQGVAVFSMDIAKWLIIIFIILAIISFAASVFRWSNTTGGIYIGTVAKTKSNLKKCVCVKCPTYSLACKIKAIPEGIADMLKRDISEEKHIEMMFCAFEPSKCIKEEKGCICNTCAVHAENNLDKTYYCAVIGGK